MMDADILNRVLNRMLLAAARATHEVATTYDPLRVLKLTSPWVPRRGAQVATTYDPLRVLKPRKLWSV